MTEATPPVKSQEQRQADLAPEMHNDEQDEHRSQAQEIAMQARDHRNAVASATESIKLAVPASVLAGQGQDMIDQMREMEDTGQIDMDAFAGEPNHDDNTTKYGDTSSG